MILALFLLFSDHSSLAQMQQAQIRRFENYAKDYEAAQVMIAENRFGFSVSYGQFENHNRWYDFVQPVNDVMTLSPCTTCSIAIDPKPEWKGWNEVRTI